MRKLIEALKQDAGLGPGGKCKCPKCGEEVSHKIGKPCNNMKCPKCGTLMSRLSA